MGNFGFFSLALLSLQALLVRGQAAAEGGAGEAQKPEQPPKLAVTVSTSFPSSEIFGVKLVNGRPAEALLSFANDEPEPVTLKLIGGSLWTLDEPSQSVRNLTATTLGTEVAPSSEQSVPFHFTTDMHPQDLRLNLAAVLTDTKGNIFTMPAYNQTVSVVEPDTSIFDPQIIFLYVFLVTCFVGVVYFFYTVWVAPYFPQKRKGGKGGDRKQKSGGQPGEQSTSADAEPVVSTGKTYDADWIPAHHIQPPTARKVKGSKPKNKP